MLGEGGRIAEGGGGAGMEKSIGLREGKLALPFTGSPPLPALPPLLTLPLTPSAQVMILHYNRRTIYSLLLV